MKEKKISLKENFWKKITNF